MTPAPISGALAGLAATAPMTLVMELMHRQLPVHERHSLPPSKITMRTAKRVGLSQHLGRQQRQVMTLVSHFGYGAAAGSLYGPLARKLNAPPLLSGVAFGLLVWLVSYLGLLPVAGLFQPATRESIRRNVLMITAHIVWGVALGQLLEAQRTSQPSSLR